MVVQVSCSVSRSGNGPSPTPAASPGWSYSPAVPPGTPDLLAAQRRPAEHGLVAAADGAKARAFAAPVRIVFGMADLYLNVHVAKQFHALFPCSERLLLPTTRHTCKSTNPNRSPADSHLAQLNRAKGPWTRSVAEVDDVVPGGGLSGPVRWVMALSAACEGLEAHRETCTSGR